IAVPHLEELFQAAEKAGLDLYAQSGYRSYARQKAIHDRLVEQYGEAYANRVSAKPGHSEHQTGLAIDVTSPDVNYGLAEELANT
ncbi:M15 family metallopeptidase, partial [Pantoea sp. SIMBA_133]